LERDLPVIRDRLGRLTPAPAGDLPVLVGGGGRKVTLRLVAEHADAWNSFGPPDTYRELNDVLDGWCREVGRDPASIERTVAINPDEVDRWQEYLDAGAQHLIVMTGPPFDLDPVLRLLEAARS
jgi:alkanesulfonate monooxygenase SsuD/methylene tetrahydromethanopterin reductase-like flavin-dependent oxidoreductase (luciferase family)